MSVNPTHAGRRPDFTSPAFYAEALGPIGLAQVLPPAAYRSLGFLESEDLAVWTRDWVCVGTQQDIPGVGDLLSFTVGTHGLHVRRGETGLVARFNKAQHGGCRLVPVQCQTGTKTRCSFTSCGHSRDRGPIAAGDLGDGTSAMHQYLGLRPERLLTAAVRSWGSMIFVSLGETATDLEQTLSGLDPDTFFNGTRSARRASQWVEYQANWKLVGQNLVGAIAGADHRHGSVLAGRVVSGEGRITAAAWLFPNLVLMADETETCAIVLQPTAIGQTLCRVSVFGPDHQGSGAAERWLERMAACGREAERDQEDAMKWGTTSRPDTIGAPLPVQRKEPGLWMQRVLAERMLAVPPATIDLQRYQIARR